MPVDASSIMMGSIAVHWAKPKHWDSKEKTEMGVESYKRLIRCALQSVPEDHHMPIVQAAVDQLLATHKGSTWPSVALVVGAVEIAKMTVKVAAPAQRQIESLDPFDGLDVMTPAEEAKFRQTCQTIDQAVASGFPRMHGLPSLKRMADEMRKRPHHVTPDAKRIREERDRRRAQ